LPTYIDWADEVFVSHQDVGQDKTEDDGEQPSAQEALYCLFRGQLDQLGAAKCDTTNVREDVVGDDEGDREEEPNHSLKDVVHDEMGLNNNQIERHMGPGKLSELEFEVTLLKRSHEEDEACPALVGMAWPVRLGARTEYVENEADEAMVGRKGQEDAINQNDMLEVVDNTLAVQEVHGGSEEVPIQGFRES
jgi:hypothetical protein